MPKYWLLLLDLVALAGMRRESCRLPCNNNPQVCRDGSKSSVDGMIAGLWRQLKFCNLVAAALARPSPRGIAPSHGYTVAQAPQQAEASNRLEPKDASSACAIGQHLAPDTRSKRHQTDLIVSIGREVLGIGSATGSVCFCEQDGSHTW